MFIVHSTCSCALACGGDKARETGRSALVSDEGGWHPPDNEVASPNASEPVSASLHHWRSANLPEVVKPAEVRTAFSVPVAARGEFYDPLQDKSYACHQQLLLAPEQSVFLRYPKWRAAVTEPRWPISFKAVCDIEPICDNMPENPDEFAGVLHYHADCTVSPQPGSKYWLRVPSDCRATVLLNDIELSPCFASPHRVEITSYLKNSENKIRLEVATTLLRLRKDTIFEKDWSPVSVLLSGKLTIEIEE